MNKKILIILNLLLITFAASTCTSANNFSFYEFFINSTASEFNLDVEASDANPDLESVPEKIEIDE